MKTMLLASAVFMTLGSGAAFASYGPSAFSTWVHEGAMGKPLTPLSQMTSKHDFAVTRTGATSTRYATRSPAETHVFATRPGSNASFPPEAVGGGARS